MSQPLTWKTGDLGGALERTSALARHVSVRQTWYEFGWRWLAGLASLLVLDLLFAIPVWFRWLGLIALLAYPVAIATFVRKRVSVRVLGEEHAARLVEEEHPDLNNALINAVQFRKVVDTASQPQAELMRQEISRAQTAVSTTPIDDVVSRGGERRARWLLLAAAGAWIAAALLIPNVVFTILPRLFAPWLDDITPPFSLTQIDISPKGASVRYGGALVVEVAVKGPIPENLSLATSANKRDWTDAPLESTEPGKYAITLSALRGDTWIVARGGGARSGRYLVRIVLPPVAQDLEATYTYPAYTARKRATEQVGDQGIHGLRDTKVDLRITANRDLTGGDLMIEPAEGPAQHFALQVTDKDPKSAIGVFPITSDGTFHIALASADSQVNSEAASGKVVLEKDNRPDVWFDEPPQEIEVTPDMKVTLGVEASDDAGVARIDLHRVINGIADSEKELYQGAPVPKTGAQLDMDMADLGVRPGDLITYYADAFDNHPGKQNYGETEPYTIKVVSAEQYKKDLQSQRDEEQLSHELGEIKDAIATLADRQQQLADKMQKLAKELKDKPNDPELQKQMAAAQQQQKQLQDEAQQMARKLQEYANSPSATPLESALKKQVGQAAKSLASTAAKSMNSAAQSSSSPTEAAAAAQQAANSLQAASKQAQSTVGEAIKNLDKVEPLFQDVSRFMALLDRQGQLVLQSRQFQDKSPSTDAERSKMAAISAEQQRVQDEIKNLQEDLRYHAANAQAEFPKAAASAVKIANEIGKRQIPDLMGSAQSGFSQDQGPNGFRNAKQALDQMEAMVSTCSSGVGQCKGEIDVQLKRSLGASGFGSSLGGMNPGQGKGNGTGVGSGAGGSQSGGNGSPANGAPNGPVAYTMDMKSLASLGGGAGTRAHQRLPGQPADLSPDSVEVLSNVEHAPPKATDSATKGYPPEYRKLIRDYFISVTKDGKG